MSAFQNLFVKTLTQSENECEGELIGQLVQGLLVQTVPENLYGCFAVIDDDKEEDNSSKESIIVAIVLTPLTFTQDLQGAFFSLARGERGIGLSLIICFGLQQIQSTTATKAVITYDSSVFYGKMGFQPPLSMDQVALPFALSQPHGWLGQSLLDSSTRQIPGPSACVTTASDNAAYW